MIFGTSYGFFDRSSRKYPSVLFERRRARIRPRPGEYFGAAEDTVSSPDGGRRRDEDGTLGLVVAFPIPR